MFSGFRNSSCSMTPGCVVGPSNCQPPAGLLWATSFPPFTLVMIINDLYVVRSVLLPHKTDAALAVYADTVLTFPVPLWRLQLVPRGTFQVVQIDRSVYLI